MLSPIDPSTLAKTPARYNSPDGDWVGISARVSVLVYNTSLVKASQLPTSAMDLAEPKWKGKIALAGTETDFQPIVTSVARAHGNAAALTWLKALKANAGSHIYPDNETIVDEVNRGQVAMGIVNQYYWYRARAEVGASNMHSKIAYFAPHDVGYVLDVSGAGILKSSKQQAAAQKFVAFLNSAQGPDDHRPQRQLRVPDRLGGDPHRRDPVQGSPAQRHHDPRAGYRRRGDQVAARGAAAVTRRLESDRVG